MTIASKPATPLPFPLAMCDAENVHSLMLSQPAAFFVKMGALDTVAVVLMPAFDNPAGKIAEQRAAYIVAACNAYPELVAALRDLVAVATVLARESADRAHNGDAQIDPARALLAKLGEGA